MVEKTKVSMSGHGGSACVGALLGFFAVATGFAAPLDYSGNGASDLAVYSPSSGQWSSRQISGAGSVNQAWGWNEAHPVPGDYNGNGVQDLAVYHRQTGTWFIRTLAGETLAWALAWGFPGGHAVAAGDYNGDGKDDLAIYDPIMSKWYIRGVNGPTIAWDFTWGATRLQPVPGDYDGDGRTDIALYDRTTGKWYIYSFTAGILAWGLDWGWGEARPVPGDYNGNGRSDLAVYHAKSGTWFIRSLGGEVIAWSTAWGFAQAHAVPGDYNGDGRSDLAVYFAPSGQWYILSLTGEQIAFGAVQGGGEAVPAGRYGQGGAGFITVCFGDSITYGRGSSSNGPNTGYPKFLDDRLQTAIGGLSYVINAGVPGETSAIGRNRIASVLSSQRPSLLLLMEGTNDLYYQATNSTILNNLSAMANSARNRGISVVMAPLAPMVSRITENRNLQHARVIGINPSIRSLAGRLGWNYAETYSSLTSVAGWQNKFFRSNETIHPNDEGYRIYRDEFIKAIRRSIDEGRMVY